MVALLRHRVDSIVSSKNILTVLSADPLHTKSDTTAKHRIAFSANNDVDAGSDAENLASNSKDIIYGEYDSEDDEHISVGEEKRETVEVFSLLKCSEDDDNNRMPKEESRFNLLSSQQLKKNRAKKKKIVVNGKQKKAPKLNIPGYAERLKIKEKADVIALFQPG